MNSQLLKLQILPYLNHYKVTSKKTINSRWCISGTKCNHILRLLLPQPPNTFLISELPSIHFRTQSSYLGEYLRVAHPIQGKLNINTYINTLSLTQQPSQGVHSWVYHHDMHRQFKLSTHFWGHFIYNFRTTHQVVGYERLGSHFCWRALLKIWSYYLILCQSIIISENVLHM